MLAMTGVSAEDATNAFVRLSEALENERKPISCERDTYFQVKSEEVEYW